MTRAKNKKSTKPHQSQASSTQRIQELEAKLARALADYQNLEKRFAQESAHLIKFANRDLLRKILELRDNLERAVQALKDPGVEMILSQLDQILKEEQVKEIPALHQPFDPHLMEVEEVVEGEKDQVVAVVRRGYLLHDRLLRPAKVKVGSGHPKAKTKSPSEPDN